MTKRPRDAEPQVRPSVISEPKTVGHLSSGLHHLLHGLYPQHRAWTEATRTTDNPHSLFTNLYLHMTVTTATE